MGYDQRGGTEQGGGQRCQQQVTASGRGRWQYGKGIGHRGGKEGRCQPGIAAHPDMPRKGSRAQGSQNQSRGCRRHDRLREHGTRRQPDGVRDGERKDPHGIQPRKQHWNAPAAGELCRADRHQENEQQGNDVPMGRSRMQGRVRCRCHGQDAHARPECRPCPNRCGPRLQDGPGQLCCCKRCGTGRRHCVDVRAGVPCHQQCQHASQQLRRQQVLSPVRSPTPGQEQSADQGCQDEQLVAPQSQQSCPGQGGAGKTRRGQELPAPRAKQKRTNQVGTKPHPQHAKCPGGVRPINHPHRRHGECCSRCRSQDQSRRVRHRPAQAVPPRRIQLAHQQTPPRH